MKTVLIVTYHFPPRQHIASLRSKGLAKYLPQFGCQPVILTAALPDRIDTDFRVIETFYPGDAIALLAKRFGINMTKDLRAKGGDYLASMEQKNSLKMKLIEIVKGIVEYPDNQRTWYNYALKEGVKLLDNEQIDAIISTAPPYTAHMIARKLKELYHIPWIADFRDLWTQNHNYTFGPIRKWLDKKNELNTLALCDAMITVSDPLAQELGSLHQGKPVFTITNGFDPDEIRYDSVLTDDFTLTYTGKIFRKTQDIALLFRAIQELVEDKFIEPESVKVQLFGLKQSWIQEEIQKYNLESIATQHGHVSRETAIHKQRQSQALLLLNWLDPKQQGVYTGKVFEYLAARRPILVIGGPGGVLRDLMEQTQAGVYLPDLDSLKFALTRFYKEFQTAGKVVYHGKDEEIIKYSHKEMARKFSEVIDKV